MAVSGQLHAFAASQQSKYPLRNCRVAEKSIALGLAERTLEFES
jgi:hypothetical protein